MKTVINLNNIPIYGIDGEFNFELEENTEIIDIGDYYLFTFGGVYSVGKCDTATEKFQINPNDKPYNKDVLDLVHGFWKKCYKIKNTNLDLSLI